MQKRKVSIDLSDASKEELSEFLSIIFSIKSNLPKNKKLVVSKKLSELSEFKSSEFRTRG